MSARKFVRFAAPYRSKTFNDKDKLLIGRNGVITGGDVTQSLSTVTIQPVTIVQGGQIVDIDVALSANVPANLIAPYFIAISISSPIENVGEVITPIFIKRPQEVNSQVVLVAEYDGTEWRQLPKLQINERIEEMAWQNVKTDMVGVTSGFDMVHDNTTIFIKPGTLISADGFNIAKDEPTIVLKAGASVTTNYERIDSVVFRKPIDSKFRVGTIEYVTGATYPKFDPQGVYVGDSGTFGSGTVQDQICTPILNGNMLVSWLESGTLKMFVLDNSFNAGATATVAASVEQYAVCYNFDGYLDFVYKRGTDLYHKRVSTTGTVIHAEAQIYTSLKQLHDPAIVCVGQPNNYQVHIAVCRELTGTTREIAYLRLASDATVITPYTSWVNLSTNLQRPSFGKDDQDSLIWMGYEDADTGRIYLATYDASTATPSTALTQIGTPVELQDDVFNLETSAAMPTSGATNIKIIRAPNKQLFVFWKHFKAVGQYGVAVYAPNYKALTGYKAVMFNDANISSFMADISGMNLGFVSFVNQAQNAVKKYVLDLEKPEVATQLDDIASGSTYTGTYNLFSSRGELVTFLSGSTGRWYECSAAYATTLREQRITATDVYMAYYRVFEDVLAISDTLVGEEPAIKRLYEFNNMFGASGVVSWGVGGANKLITTAITIQFLNRSAVYTLPATPLGVTIPDGYAIYVEIPDEDISANLTYKVTKFGQGKLDRIGKKAVPLFWNVGGRLFSNFAPYSFSDGETVVIGGTISAELQAWLGISTSAPDASDHNYNSTNYILESDGINTAIGKLDNAISGVVSGGSAAIIPLTQGTTSVSVTFGSPRATANYRISTTFENTTDTDPMYQPVMITAKDVNGFTLSWPSGLDSGNYLLDYLLRDTV